MARTDRLRRTWQVTDNHCTGAVVQLEGVWVVGAVELLRVISFRNIYCASTEGLLPQYYFSVDRPIMILVGDPL